MDEVGRECVEALVGSVPPAEALAALTALLAFARNLLTEPGNPKFRHINLGNEKFQQRVWRHEAARNMMSIFGWQEADGAITLPEGDMSAAIPFLEQAVAKLGAHAPSSAAAPPAAAATASASACASPQQSERMKRIAEERRKQQAQLEHDLKEKERVRLQIEADRRDVATRRAQASHANQLQFGGRTNTFKDVGIDLNKGGG